MNLSQFYRRRGKIPEGTRVQWVVAWSCAAWLPNCLENDAPKTVAVMHTLSHLFNMEKLGRRGGYVKQKELLYKPS